jgi:hypothetical protein
LIAAQASLLAQILVQCRSSVRFTDRAKVAKLPDAPDLGLRNRRFQGVAFRFKADVLTKGKTLNLLKRSALQLASRSHSN